MHVCLACVYLNSKRSSSMASPAHHITQHKNYSISLNISNMQSCLACVCTIPTCMRAWPACNRTAGTALMATPLWHPCWHASTARYKHANTAYIPRMHISTFQHACVLGLCIIEQQAPPSRPPLCGTPADMQAHLGKSTARYMIYFKTNCFVWERRNMGPCLMTPFTPDALNPNQINPTLGRNACISLQEP